jgi:protein phosphatase
MTSPNGAGPTDPSPTAPVPGQNAAKQEPPSTEAAAPAADRAPTPPEAGAPTPVEASAPESDETPPDAGDLPASPEATDQTPVAQATGPAASSPADPAAPAAEPVPAAPPAKGSVVADRYTVQSSLSAADATAMTGSTLTGKDAEFYAVEDRRGYERCWSCGSTGNGEQQRFCIDCGAPLQHRQVVLARTATPTGEADEFAESGSYFHLVSPRKQFGSTGITLEVGAFSAEGPHHPNEDSYWIATAGGCYDSVSQTIGVMTLADGMGGYAPGSGLISKVIVGTVGRGVFGILHEEHETEIQEGDLQAVVKGAIAEANGKVLDEIRQHGEMGATLVTAVIHGQTAYVANIGDSRAYYIAPSGAVAQITRDQSLIEQQVAAGLLSPDAVYTALGNNVILHAIGEDNVEEAFDWYVQPLEPGSRLLLCSDGYWKTMQHDIWDGESAAKQPSLRSLARAMVENALARESDDNTTVVLVGID